MQHIRQSKMHGMHLRVGKQLVEACISPRQAESEAGLFGAFRAAPENARHMNIFQPPEGLDMYGANESGAGYGYSCHILIATRLF